ncbi:hypothetical protein R3P38DRAFT_2814125 [Favolaschia claudopus]|uniref:Uncharacterized protein n=1 Tax=Favolaschia claudopus TaxID=2862362 RepID=A0AAV9Z3K7_9AGAR
MTSRRNRIVGPPESSGTSQPESAFANRGRASSRDVSQLGFGRRAGAPASSTSTLVGAGADNRTPDVTVPVPPTARVTPAVSDRQPNAYILSVTILVAFLHTRHHVSFRACALILLVLNLLLRAVPGEILGKEKLPGSLQTVFSRLSISDRFKIYPTPPSKPNPPKPNTRTAASTASLLLNKTRDELLNPSDIPWDSIDTADVIRHLASKGFIPAENGRSISLPYLEDIAMILLRIGADASSVVTKNACRAVAMLLERWKRDEIIEDLADDVKKLLAKHPHEGHGAADRLCPVFQNKFQAANPEAKYPYFLDPDDPTTWVTHDDVSSEFATRRGPPTWQSAQAMRQPRGPGPAPEIAAHHKANFTRQHRRPATQVSIQDYMRPSTRLETRVDNIATTTDDDKVTDTAANDDNASATTEDLRREKVLSHRVNRGKINMEVTLSDLHADPPPAELDADTLSQRALSDDADERDIMDGPGLELPQGVDDHHVI